MQCGNRHLHRVPLNQSHGIKMSTVFSAADGVDGNNIGMFKMTCDRCFQQKATDQCSLADQRAFQFLESHFPLKIIVERGVDRPNSTFSDSTKNSKTQVRIRLY